MQSQSPVGFAELIHNNIAVYDSFPDGNTRTARLMSYIVLMQAGYRPAVFSGKDDYSLIWSSLRSLRKNYFYEAVVEGQK